MQDIYFFEDKVSELDNVVTTFSLRDRDRDRGVALNIADSAIIPYRSSYRNITPPPTKSPWIPIRSSPCTRLPEKEEVRA